MLWTLSSILLIYLYIFFDFGLLCSCNKIIGPHHTYLKLTLEDDRLCSFVTKREIKLSRTLYSALIVSPTRSKDHSSTWTTNLNCKFQIHAPIQSGIFAVIQSINFRRNDTTGECIDFVQFKAKSDLHSPKICGEMSIDESLDDTFTVSDSAFIDKYGKLDVNVFIAREKLQYGERTELLMVFTTFAKCDGQTLPCTEETLDYCLSSQYFNDGYVNCPYSGCVDEYGCENLEQPKCVGGTCVVNTDEEPISSTKLMLSAIASICVSFIVFASCIWLCKKTGTLCWTSDWVQGVRNNTRNRNAESRVMEMQNRPDESAAAVNVSAPAVPEEDKDLPPSYDSLFPPR